MFSTAAAVVVTVTVVFWVSADKFINFILWKPLYYLQRNYKLLKITWPIVDRKSDKFKTSVASAPVIFAVVVEASVSRFTWHHWKSSASILFSITWSIIRKTDEFRSYSIAIAVINPYACCLLLYFFAWLVCFSMVYLCLYLSLCLCRWLFYLRLLYLCLCLARPLFCALPIIVIVSSALLSGSAVPVPMLELSTLPSASAVLVVVCSFLLRLYLSFLLLGLHLLFLWLSAPLSASVHWAYAWMLCWYLGCPLFSPYLCLMCLCLCLSCLFLHLRCVFNFLFVNLNQSLR